MSERDKFNGYAEHLMASKLPIDTYGKPLPNHNVILADICRWIAERDREARTEKEGT